MLSGTVSRWQVPTLHWSADRNPLSSNKHTVTAPDPASAFSASGRRSRHREHQRPPSRRRPTSNVRRPAGAISTSSNPAADGDHAQRRPDPGGFDRQPVHARADIGKGALELLDNPVRRSSPPVPAPFLVCLAKNNRRGWFRCTRWCGDEGTSRRSWQMRRFLLSWNQRRLGRIILWTLTATNL